VELTKLGVVLMTQVEKVAKAKGKHLRIESM